MKRGLAVLLAAVVLLSAAAPVLAATASVNFDADAAQDPYIEDDVTKATHDMEWGTNETAALMYEDDSGEVSTLNATVNESEDVNDLGSGHVNPYSFVVSDVNESDFGEFPHAKSDVSALEASEWTTSVTDTTNTALTTSDSTTAPGVDAVEIGTGGSMGAGDKATATFSNFSITSDAEKRYMQVGVDVTTLDADASVAVRYIDSDGDYVESNISSTATASDADVIANGTGDGYMLQEQVGSMTVAGTGDSTMQEIQTIEVIVEEADATVKIMALNADKTGEWTLGEEHVDTDTEDDLETNTIKEVYTAGEIEIHSLSTMGSTFDDATIHDLDAPVQFRASHLPADKDLVNVSFENASNYPSFEHRQSAYYRLTMPDAYDLSHSNAELKLDMSVPESRYQTVEFSEGVGDTNFTDISWTDVSGSTVSQGETASLDTTLQVGQEIGVHVETLNTGDERDSLLAAGGGAGGQFEQGGGGGGGIFGTIFAAIGALLGGSWLFGKPNGSAS